MRRAVLIGVVVAGARAARFTPGRIAGRALRPRFEMPVELKLPTRN
jgi:hypothetical protein